MNNILITIAIPAYNNEKSIQKVIDSCLNQETNVEYEILIVNDASTDNTKNIIEKNNNKKIRVINNSQGSGIVGNHNICLNNSVGEYILFCHGDDKLESHAIETLSKKIKSRNYPKKYVLWGHSMFRDFSINVKRSGFMQNEMIVGEYAQLIFMYGGLTPSGTCYSRESFVELNGFLPANHRLAPMDMTTMLYLSINEFRFEMIDEMIFIRTFGTTLTSETKNEDILDSLDEAFGNFLKVIEPNQIVKLLTLSSNLEYIPYNFYYAIAQDHQYKKFIVKALTKKLPGSLLLLRHKAGRELLKRLIF